MSMLSKITGAGPVSLVLALVLGTASPGRADYPVAPDVVVFCEPTLRHALTDVAGLWRSQSGLTVRIFTAPNTRLLLAEIAHHARDDVLVGEGDANSAAAENQQLIKPATLRPFGRNRLVVAALNGSFAEKDDSLAAIAGKGPIAIVDPWADAAGAATQQALQSLGLWQKVNGKSVGVAGTADAAYLLSDATVRLAIVYATDVAADPALRVAERPPAASYAPIVYWVAETTHALSPNAAKFTGFLSSAAAQERLRADGLEISR